MLIKKIYCTKGNRYAKFKNPKTLYIFNKTLVPFIKCGSNNKKNKEKKSIDILKILGLSNDESLLDVDTNLVSSNIYDRGREHRFKL